MSLLSDKSIGNPLNHPHHSLATTLPIKIEKISNRVPLIAAQLLEDYRKDNHQIHTLHPLATQGTRFFSLF